MLAPGKHVYGLSQLHVVGTNESSFMLLSPPSSPQQSSCCGLGFPQFCDRTLSGLGGILDLHHDPQSPDGSRALEAESRGSVP